MATLPPAEKFQDLIVWQKAHQLVLLVYRLTKTLPKEELFGLVSQMRRAAVSVPATLLRVSRSAVGRTRLDT